MRLALCLISALLVTGAAAAPRQIAIYNDADFAIVQLQARAPKTKPWTIELLGKHSLGVGRATKAALPANATACAYHLLARHDHLHGAGVAAGGATGQTGIPRPSSSRHSTWR